MAAVLTAVDGEGIATFTLNRPEKYNALDEALFSEGLVALRELAARDDVRALIVTGAGKAFCAGADLQMFQEWHARAGGVDIGRVVSASMRSVTNPFTQAIAEFPKPVICAINGIAAGGGAGIALAGDIILAGRSAGIKVVQVNQLGIIGDLGVNWLIPRMAGRAAAMGALLLGETINAERAERLGLVWEVVEDAALMERAHAMARTLSKAPADTVLATRALVDLSVRQQFAEFLEAERAYQRDLTSRPEFIERVGAFLKRPRK
jgi:2-(1,2-epoxy-1,2-dihydrophenyl)acetyl-CoA isomerase